MRRYLLTLLISIASLGIFTNACQSEGTIRVAQYMTNGQSLYKKHCENCHGGKGEGLGKLYPPLTDEKYLKDNRDKLPCFIKHGMSGEITIHGQKYDGTMPENPQLSAVEIAYILTYIGNTFGNEMGLFSFEEVNKSLKNCK